MSEFDPTRRLWLQRSAKFGFLMSTGAGTCAALAAERTRSDEATSVQVQDGDVIFRECTPDATTRFIKQVSPIKPGRWTHVGVIRWTKGTDSAATVIHACPERKTVITEPLHEFISVEQAQGFALVRPNLTLAAQITGHAQSFLGMPFDFEMRTSDLQSLYCTELVARAWVASQSGRSIRPLRTIHLLPHPEPILHADGLFADLLEHGDFALMGASSWT